MLLQEGLGIHAYVPTFDSLLKDETVRELQLLWLDIYLESQLSLYDHVVLRELPFWAKWELTKCKRFSIVKEDLAPAQIVIGRNPRKAAAEALG